MKECIIIGGGWSVKEGIELGLWDKIKGKEIWSLNYSFLTIPYLPSRQLWVDIPFYKSNVEKLQKLYENGVKLTCKEHPIYSFVDGIEKFQVSREKPIEKSIYIGTMGLVGMFALSIAVKEKYDRIFLLGYDFGTKSVEDTNTHYYQNDINVDSSGVRNPYVYYDSKGKINRNVKEYDIYKDYNKIYNVSINSNIESFEKITYNRFFELIEERNG